MEDFGSPRSGAATPNLSGAKSHPGQEVAKTEYDAYYEGCGIAHALALSDVWAHEAPVEIEGVRRALPGFQPPQSWRYARGRELEWLQWFKLSATASAHAPYCPALP